MKIDPTAFANIDRINRKKANIIKAVTALPNTAQEGDMVLLQGSLHIRLEGQWHNINATLISAIQKLGIKLTAEIEALDTKLTADIDTLDNNLTTEIQALDRRIRNLEDN